MWPMQRESFRAQGPAEKSLEEECACLIQSPAQISAPNNLG